MLVHGVAESVLGFPCGSAGKESTCNVGGPRFDPSVGKIPWRRKWQSTPALLPGKSHGRKSLIGYSPLGHKESDTAERLTLSLSHFTLPAKVRLVKAMVFPVVLYGCESWTIKKAERQRIDAFELWCWRRLLS